MNDQDVSFNVFKVMKYPCKEVDSVVDVMDDVVVGENVQSESKDLMEVFLV